MSLAENQKIMLPGGWSNKNGGHAIIYQLVRKAAEYDFVVINSGAGLEYHAKKSALDKELYNPTKVWSFPLSNSIEETAKISHFISSLLKANLPQQA
ncbi:MAG: hypothetical protein PSV35_06900, partial [bacterium]|nr:hypothetical protein [bacterium]